MSSIQDLRALVDDFVEQLSSALETQAIVRARHAVEAALAGHGLPRGNGGLRAAVLTLAGGGLGARKPRKKPPVQLCPVPGCTERAAPIFGMVCSKHKDVPKAKIRQYREARRAGKVAAKSRRASGGKAAAAKAPTARKTAKAARKPQRAAKPRRAAAATAKTPPTPTKVEVVQKPAQVRVSAAVSARIKPKLAKRPAVPREAPPPPAPATTAPAPAQA